MKSIGPVSADQKHKDQPLHNSADRKASEVAIRSDPSRAAGNLALQRLLREGVLHASLEVGRADDPLEREADAAAEHCERGTPCAHSAASCNGCAHRLVMRKAKSGPAAALPPPGLAGAPRSGGRPLDPPVRAEMETALGADFSSVRIHTDRTAAASAQSIGALAYTASSDIVFGAGQYSPETREGRKLLAHELTHVVQQQESSPRIQRVPVPDAREGTITVGWAANLSDEDLQSQAMAVRDVLLTLEPQDPTRQTLVDNLQIIVLEMAQRQLPLPDTSFLGSGAPSLPTSGQGAPPSGATTPPSWEDLITLAEQPVPRMTSGGFRSQSARIGNLGVTIIEGPVGAQLPQSETLAGYTPTLPTEHATHSVGMQLGENLPEGITSAPSHFNLSEMKIVENTIREIHDAAQQTGAMVETRTIAQISYVTVGNDEIPVLVGVEREAWLVLPGTDTTFPFVNFKAHLDPATRSIVIDRNWILRPAGAAGTSLVPPAPPGEIPECSEETETYSQSVLQEAQQLQQAALALQQAEQNPISPANVENVAELNSPTAIQRIVSENGGWAMIEGQLYRVSMTGTSINVRLITPSPIAVPRLPTGAGTPSGVIGGPGAFPSTGQMPALPPVGAPRAGPGGGPGGGAPPALPPAGGGPRAALPPASTGGPMEIPFAPPSRMGVPPNILNFTPQDIIVAGRRIAPTPEGMPRVGEYVVVGFENYWVVSNIQTRQPVAGVFEGGQWYVVVSEGRALPIDAEGRIRSETEPIPFEELPAVAQRGPLSSEASAGGGPSTGARAVAAGVGIIMVANEILGGIGRVRAIQQYNIDVGYARFNFWIRFGGNPQLGIWDQTDQRALPSDTVPSANITSPSFPYIAEIDVASLASILPAKIRNYQDLLLFLDLGKSIGAIIETPPMPAFPSRDERRTARQYLVVVNAPDQAHRRQYDITDLINQMRNRTLGQLEESMRSQLRDLPASEQNNIFRLRSGSETPLFRSAQGGQPIYSDQQILGPNPWVRPLGRRIEGGVWSWFRYGHGAARVLVAAANADAQRSALVSTYRVKKSIEDTLEEVRSAGRPIKSRTPAEGTLQSFTAGPEPGESSRFGETRYYRDPEMPYSSTAAIGELRSFWVNADDLEPVAETEVQSYIQRQPPPPEY